MDPKKAFRFCPRCAGGLAVSSGNAFACRDCRRHFYINPFPTNGVIIENSRGEILLVKRAFAPKKNWWDVPGGFIQPQESVEASIRREVKEELNVDVVVGRLVGVYTDVYVFEGVVNYTLCVMAAASITGGTIKPADDASDFRFFPKQLILRQKIAFVGVKKGLTDYIKVAASLPNLTA